MLCRFALARANATHSDKEAPTRVPLYACVPLPRRRLLALRVYLNERGTVAQAGADAVGGEGHRHVVAAERSALWPARRHRYADRVLSLCVGVPQRLSRRCHPPTQSTEIEGESERECVCVCE
jgi:hypothetical protein